MTEQRASLEERLLAVFTDRHGPDGWDIKVSSTDAAVSVELNHPVSMPHGFGFLRDTDHAAFLDRVPSNPEFEVVKRRPRRRKNWSLLQALRQAARVNRWDREVLTTVALVLQSQKILSSREATWLMEAGPVFHIPPKATEP